MSSRLANDLKEFSRAAQRLAQHLSTQTTSSSNDRRCNSSIHSQRRLSIISLPQSPIEIEEPMPFGHPDEDWDALPDILQTLSQVTNRISKNANTLPSPPASANGGSIRTSRQSTRLTTDLTPGLVQTEDLKFSGFCQRVRENPTYENASLASLTCYKDVEGIPHEFLIAHVRVPDAPDMWIRLERAADFTRPSSWISRLYPVSSNYAADDKVRISADESDLISRSGGISPKEKLIFKRDKLSLRSFAVLLEIFTTEAGSYTLRKKNCWFLCSVIMENLVAMSSNPIKVRRLSLGKDIRKRIRTRYLQEGMRSI